MNTIELSTATVTFTDYGFDLPHSLIVVTDGSTSVDYTARELNANLNASGRNCETGVYTLSNIASALIDQGPGFDVLTETGRSDDGYATYALTSVVAPEFAADGQLFAAACIAA